MEVNNINSGPDYIHAFVESNIEQLNEIYDKGLNDSGEGILFCKCSIDDNRIEIIYMTKDLFIENNTEEIWNDIQADKRIVLIEDLDISSIFVLYI
jgi:hypothetical protein